VPDFNEHVATIIFEAEGGEFGRRHGDSTTGFDRVQEEAGDGNRHGKTAKWRLEDGELPRICRRVHCAEITSRVAQSKEEKRCGAIKW
jgi:hypothetical protein